MSEATNGPQTKQRSQSPRCQKCGSTDINTSWHGDGAGHRTRRYAECRSYGEMRGLPQTEHLHYVCRNCQWEWTGPLAPPPADPEGAEAPFNARPVMVDGETWWLQPGRYDFDGQTFSIPVELRRIGD